MISFIPTRILSKNQIKNFPINNRFAKKTCFEDFQSDNESAESESESAQGMIATYKIPSAQDLIMSAKSLKQKSEEFEIEWKTMIQDILTNHDI